MNKILEMKFGSALYGTSTPKSDVDIKGIYLPTAREIVLGTYKKTISTCRTKREFERNTKDDIDTEFFSLDRYLELLTEGQTVALDMLFAGPSSYTYLNHNWAPVWQEIFDNRDKLLTRNVCAFIGYAKQQASKYGLKGFRVHALRIVLDMLKSWEGKSHRLGDCDLADWVANCGNENIRVEYLKAPNGNMEPFLNVCDKKIAFHATVKYAVEHVQRRFDEYGKRALMAEKNEGVDQKSLSHAVRVNSEAIELLETGHITFPRPDRELLLNIKLGKIPYKQVAEIIENGLEQLKMAQLKSKLRDEPDKEWVNDFIYKVYSQIVRDGE